MATNALAPRGSTEVMPAESNNPLVKLRGQLEQRATEFKMVLPAHISPEKFQRTILTAVQSDPDLLKADRQSFILACMKAAQDGLLPDKREAALVIFKENKKVNGEWVTRQAVQYMPMVYGLRKKILQSEEVTDITAKVVYRREHEEGHFIYEEGTEAMLRHKPMLDLTAEEAADSQIIAAYSMATYADGSKSYEVMRRFEIDKVRECSQTGATRDRKGQPRTPSGPWVDWYPEQAKKTVMRRHSKTLPMSGDLIDVEATDDALYARSAEGLLGSTVPDAPVATLPRRDEVDHDPETGEVSDEQPQEEVETADERPADEAVTNDAPLARADGQPGYDLNIDPDWTAWLDDFRADLGRAENVIAAKNLFDAAEKDQLVAAPAEVVTEAERLRDERVEAIKAAAKR